MQNETREKVKEILRKCVKGAMDRTSKKIRDAQEVKPFHTALLTEEIVKISSFERSFSTSFGQGPIEKISELIAFENGFEALRQKEVMANVYKGAIDEIERICSSLRSGQQTPNWKKEVQLISSYTKGDTVVRRIISDLWLKKDGQEHFISIKTVSPNLDQSEIAKKDMLLLKAASQSYKTYFGLYYNPYGVNRLDYKHSFPMRIFDMHYDSCVLIGKDYWDFVGGVGAYKNLIEVFAEVGNETRKSLIDF